VDAVGGDPLVRTPDLGADNRWPHYGPRAYAELGISSQLTIEMHTSAGSYGASIRTPGPAVPSTMTSPSRRLRRLPAKQPC
jgi:hypothetical protein